MFTWKAYIDFDYQGLGSTPDFSQITDNVSAYVMNVDIKEGGDYTELRPDISVGSCTLTMKNIGREFDIHNTSSPFYGKLRTGLAVKVEIRVSRKPATPKTWFYGIIQNLSPDDGLFGARQATINCVDFLAVLQASLVDLPLIRNVRSDVLVKYVLNSSFNTAKAQRMIDFPDNPTTGMFIYIDGLYLTYVNSLTADDQVLIGSTVYETVTRTIAAINGGQGAGTTYSTNINRPPYILAAPSGDYFTIAVGSAANRFYYLNEAAGSVATDLGTNAVNATYAGAAASGHGLVGVGFPVVTDLATNFGGVSGYLAIPTANMSKRTFSAAFWVRLHTTIANSYLFDIRGSAGGAFSVRMDNTGKIFVDVDGVNVINSGATVLGIGSHHIAVSQGRFTVSLYLNGVLVATAASVLFDDPDTTNMTLGARDAGAGDFCTGVFEKFSLHFLEMTQGTVTALFNSRYTPTGVVFTYRINGSVGNSALFTKYAAAPKSPIRSPYEMKVARSLPTIWHAQSELVGSFAQSRGTNGNSGTYNGGYTLAQLPLNTGSVNQESVLYDGINGYLAPPNININSRSFTFEFLIAFNSFAVDFDIFNVYVAAATGQSLLVRGYTDRHIALDFAGGGQAISAAGVLAPVGATNHIVIRHDTATSLSSIWVNGVKVAQGTTTGFTTATTPTIRFMWSVFPIASTSGRAAHFCHYNRAMPDAEIVDHYGALFNANLQGGADYTDNVQLDTGIAQFEIAADQWSPITTNALSAITNVMSSEIGRFYQSRGGVLRFENRDSRFTKASGQNAALTLHNEPEVIAVVNRTDIYSSVSVTVTPRRLDTNIGIVAEANDLIVVSGRSSSQPILPNGAVAYRTTSLDKTNNYRSIDVPPTVIELQYLDPVSKKKIGVHKLIKPLLAGTDWTANEFRDFTGYDYTFYSPPQLDFILVDQGQSVKVYITNKALGDLYVKLKIRGYKVNYDDPLTITKDNPTIFTGRSLRNAATINIPLGGNGAFAAAYASYLINLYNTDRQYVRELDFGAQLQVGNVDLLDLEIGDTIRVNADQAGIYNQLYEITGVEFSFGGGGDGVTTRPESQLKFKVRRLDDLLFGAYDNFYANYDQCYYTL